MQNWKKYLLAGALPLAMIGTMASTCDGSGSGDKQEKKFTARSQKHFDEAQPPHAYDASQARNNLLAAQDAMAEGADTWTVQTVPNVGITFQCPSVGFPIPFGSQITNPVKVDATNDLTTPQQEPYGIYPPADVAATYANCVLPNGQIGIFYSEPDLTTFGFDVKCDDKGHCTIPPGSQTKVKVTKVDRSKVHAHNADGSGN